MLTGDNDLVLSLLGNPVNDLSTGSLKGTPGTLLYVLITVLLDGAGSGGKGEEGKGWNLGRLKKKKETYYNSTPI